MDKKIPIVSSDSTIGFILICLKCHYDQILDTHFFYIFQHKRCFLDILANFNLSRTLELMFFGPLFPTVYGRH